MNRKALLNLAGDYGICGFDVECLLGTSYLLDVSHEQHVLRHQASYTK